MIEGGPFPIKTNTGEVFPIGIDRDLVPDTTGLAEEWRIAEAWDIAVIKQIARNREKGRKRLREQMEREEKARREILGSELDGGIFIL
jgi:hypothetical protein